MIPKRFKNFSPQNKERAVPNKIKGAKGRRSFKDFLRDASIAPANIAAVQKENRKDASAPGKPTIRDTAKNNLASPSPIHFPLETNQSEAGIIAKNKAYPRS